MRSLFPLLTFGGLTLTALGFATVFAMIEQVLPATAVVAVGGAVAIGGGMLLVLAGLLVCVLRRPTPRELARQRRDDYATWHFRPLGLLLTAAVVAAFVRIGEWADRQLPGINQGRHPPTSYAFALVVLGLLAIPRVRRLVFSATDAPAPEEDERPGGTR